jgi:hypothetical protein
MGSLYNVPLPAEMPPPSNLVIQVFISAALLAAAVGAILSESYEITDKHWAFGAIGTVMGFWFHRHSAREEKI